MLLSSVPGMALTVDTEESVTYGMGPMVAPAELDNYLPCGEFHNEDRFAESMLDENWFFYLEPCEPEFFETIPGEQFEDNSVIVILTRETSRMTSREHRHFTARDFRGVGAVYVEDLIYLDEHQNTYAQQLWEAERSMAIAERNMAIAEENMVAAQRNTVATEESFLDLSVDTEQIYHEVHQGYYEARQVYYKARQAYYEAHQTYYENRLKAEEAYPMANFDLFRRFLLVRLDQNCEENVLNVIYQLQQREYIYWVGPNHIFRPDTINPNDPYFRLPATNVNHQWAVNRLSLPQAWGITTGSPVRVGIIGHGIDANHEELIGRVSAAPCGRLFDPDAMGTMQAGIIGAAGNNGVGIAGISWNVQLVSLGIMNHASGVQEAVRMGIPILTRSFSGGERNTAIYIAVRDYYRGLFINSAGNEDNNTDISNRQRFPGLSNVIVVGASDMNDGRSVWNATQSSNYGRTSVHLFAPGGGLINGVRRDIRSTTPGSLYGFYNGTSASAPHVAGVAALVLSVNPTLTPQQVRSIILNNVDPIPAFANISVSGGRLNAYRAVRAAQPAQPTRSVRFNDNFAGANQLIQFTTANAFVQNDATVTFNNVRTGTAVNSRYDQTIGTAGTVPARAGHVFSNLRGGRLVPSGGSANTPTANRYWMVSQTQTASVFGGWFDTQARANAHTAQTGRVLPTHQLPAGTAVIDLFARWYPTRTITFNPQGGTLGGSTINLTRRAVAVATPSTSALGARATNYGQVLNASNQILAGVAVENNGAAAVAIPTRAGFTFNGWWTAASGGTRVTNTTALPAGNVTLHAQWTASARLPAPTNVQVTNITHNSVLVTWNAVPGAWGYRVERSNGAYVSTTGTTSSIVTGLAANSNHIFRVVAQMDWNQNNPGNSLPSANVSFWTRLQPPTMLATDSITRNSARLRWNAVPGAWGYRVERADGTYVATITETTRIVTGLTPNTQHSFRVVAQFDWNMNNPRNSLPGTTVTFRTLA